MTSKTVLFFALIINFATASKILCIFPTPFFSHQSVFQPIWQELAVRGHEVTVITTNPIKNTSLKNLKEIDLSFSYKLVYEDHKMQHVINTESNLLVLMKHVFLVMNNMTIEQLEHPEVKELIKNDDNFDLIIVEIHVPAWFGFAKKYRCPIIAVTSMEAPNHFKRIIGNLNNPVFTHHFNLPFDKEMTFFRRVICVIFEIFDEFQTSYLLYPFQQNIIRKALNDNEIHFFDILKNVSLLLTSVIPGFNKVTTHIPSVIQLNGMQIKQPKVLPEEIKTFLDQATDGAIYFCLGSNVKSYLISNEKLSILLGAFAELPYRIIWKFEEEVSDLPPNVIILKWTPQQDILRHKNVKLFITQGGLQSIDEGIRYEVPLLGLPFFGDQFFNVMRIKDLGLGTWIDFTTITKEIFKNAILEIIDNSTILANLNEISDLLDQPPKSLDKAVWWIEYVIRHKGAYHLRSPLADILFYQYYLFDVILFLIVFCSVIIGILIKLIRMVKTSTKSKVNKLKAE